MPNSIARDEAVATENYGRYVVEPLEAGYGQTLGTCLRRTLLSSLEGAAISAVKISGALHEFTSLPGVVEDVPEIVLNLKKIRFFIPSREPHTLTLDVVKEGSVVAGDIQLETGVELVNPDQIICTLDKKQRLEMEMEVKVGRGFLLAEENKKEEQAIGLIPIDCLFSPVRRVKYEVENTRVGQRTDYDRLILEVWTDGRISADDALMQAAAILRHHLDLFVGPGKEPVEFEKPKPPVQEAENRLRKILNMSVNEIELSVRAANCLNNANIATVGQLAQKTEAEMLKYRNFGKKSLNEIKSKLAQLGLSLGMKFGPELLEAPLVSEALPED
nr:DNA-directed RNA polymerase subunit alpha [Verrucomicrobium sp. 3C]